MTPATGTGERFGDRLARVVAARRSQLVLGLDPDPGRLWPRALQWAREGATGRAPAVLAAQAVTLHCVLAIEAVAEHCVAVKLQAACFERLGAAGWAAMAEVAAHARRHDLLVIADAKRGDIDVSAAAYGQAFFSGVATPFGHVPGLGADAMTINPLLGRDGMAPLVVAARAAGAGVFALVRTSNPGAADVQEQDLAAGGAVSGRLAALVAAAGAQGIGASGLSDVGAVVGATAPERLESMRALMPHAVFLLPGIGAQGGRPEDLRPVFAAGPASGLVSASRGIVNAHEREGGDPASAAAAEAQRLRALVWELATRT